MRRYRSAHKLAQSFGSPVLEPTWWPEDKDIRRRVTYRLLRGDAQIGPVIYLIGKDRRHDGPPVGVMGHLEEGFTGYAAAEDPSLPWSPVRGPEGISVRTVDGYVQAVVHVEQQVIRLVGYASEDEVVRAVRSLRRVTAE
jgi:hypothetical protein